MKRKTLALLGTMTATLCTTGSANAGPIIELIQNGEFEEFSSASRWKSSGWLKADSVPGWQGISEGHIEIWKEGVMNSPTHGTDGKPTGFHAETTGDSQNSVISTIFRTPEWRMVSGGGMLSFDVWNRKGGGVNFFVQPLSPEPALNVFQTTSSTLFSVTPQSTKGHWVRHEQWLDLLPNTEYQLSFRGIRGGTSGSHIDQVSLRVTSADVPAPAPAALVALGLAALGLRRRATEQRRRG